MPLLSKSSANSSCFPTLRLKLPWSSMQGEKQLSSGRKQGDSPSPSSPSCSQTCGSCDFRSTGHLLPHHEPAAQDGQRNPLHSKYRALHYVPSSTSAPAALGAQLHQQLVARPCFASSSLREIACSAPAAGGDVSSREVDCFLLPITSRELDSPAQIAG